MNNISFKHRWPGIVIFLLMLVMSRGALGDEDQSEYLRTLKTGIDEYLRKVEFKCTYTYSVYVVDSREKAESFDTSDARLLLRATGSMIKSKTMTYERFELDQANTERDLFLDNHITVTNSDLRANYVKQSEDSPNRTLFVLELEKTNSGIPLLDQVHAPIICPLTYGGGRKLPNCIDSCFLMLEKYPNETTIDISHNDGNTIVSRHFDLPNFETTHSTTTLSGAYSYPVVMSKDKETHSYLRNSDSYGKTGAFDLVELGKGIAFPKKIYDMTGPIEHKDYGEEAIGKWIVQKWESEDLGEERPKAKDFLIPLDRDTKFGGLDLDLVYKLDHNVPEYFDLNSFSPADLFYSTEPNAAAPKASASRHYRPVLIVLGALIVAVGIYRKWRNRRRDHADQS